VAEEARNETWKRKPNWEKDGKTRRGVHRGDDGPVIGVVGRHGVGRAVVSLGAGRGLGSDQEGYHRSNGGGKKKGENRRCTHGTITALVKK